MRTTTRPIKNELDLARFKDYYLHTNPNPRNYILIVISLNTALRISDILTLKWGSFVDSRGNIKSHLELIESKTGKFSVIAINENISSALRNYYLDTIPASSGSDLDISPSAVLLGSYIFTGKDRNIPLSRVQAFRIIKKAALECNLGEHISCHSLRKTFGYHAWKQGIPPALLMDIYNHSSYKVTKRYLCIDQDDRDKVFRSVKL